MSITPIFRHSLRAYAYDPFTTTNMMWDPFFSNLENEHIIICTPHVRPNTRTESSSEWRESPEVHVFRAEIPGFDKEDMKVEIDVAKKRLTISGLRKVEKEEKRENWYSFESSERHFTKVFTLPEGCKPGKIRFTVENGVIEIKVPYQREVKAIRLE